MESFRRIGSGSSFDIGYSNAIRAVVAEPDGGEIRNAIGRDVHARITELVKQLLFHDIGVDATARARMLGDHERSIGLGFNDGISDVRHIRDVGPIHLAVSSGALRAALDDMSGDGSGRQQIPVRLFPAEPVNHRRKRESSISAAAGDHDVRAGGEASVSGKAPI